MRALVVVLVVGCGRFSFERSDGSLDQGGDGQSAVAPLATYSLNEGGGQAVDNSVPGGSAVNGILGNNLNMNMFDPTWAAGRHGSGLAFDLVDDRVDISYAPSGFFVELGTNDAVTISAWVRLTMVGASDRVAYQIGGESNGATLGVLVSGAVRLALRNADVGKTVDSTTILQPDTWYFLAMTSDPTGATLYIYNEAGTQLEVTATPGPFPWVTGSDGIAIGNNPNNNSGLYGLIGAGPEPFGGVVDEVRVYGAAVSQTQLELDLQTPLP